MNPDQSALMRTWNHTQNTQFKCSDLLWDVISTNSQKESYFFAFNYMMRTNTQWWANSVFGTLYLIYVGAKKIRAQISLFINTNLLFFCRTCQREAWQLNIEWWTNPCWSISRGLFCQARAVQRNCSYLREVLLCTDMLSKYMRASAISIYPITDLISPFFTSPPPFLLPLSNDMLLLNAYCFSSLVLMSSFY